MNILKYLLSAAALIAVTSCAPKVEEKSYPKLENIENTVWESRTQDNAGKVYYHTISFESAGIGTLSTFDTSDLQTALESIAFSYEFPLNDNYGMIVRFEDAVEDAEAETSALAGKRYDGYLIQKGVVKIDLKDVYLIQLFEVDANGNILLNDKQEPASTIAFWKE